MKPLFTLILLLIVQQTFSQSIVLKGVDKPLSFEAPLKNSILLTNIAGRDAIQFILNADDPTTGGSKRAELGYPFWQGKKEQWVSFGLLAPTNYVKDSIINNIGDFHSMPDTAFGETWTVSPISMYIQRDSVFLKVMWSKSRVNSMPDGITDCDAPPVIYNMGKLDKGVYVDWKIHVLFGYQKKQGVLEVWKNNNLVVSRVNLPNSYNDKTPPSFKFGLYIWDWANKKIVPKVKQRIIYFSDPTIY